MLVRNRVPEIRARQTSVRFPYSHLLVDPFLYILELIFDFLECERVWPLSLMIDSAHSSNGVRRVEYSRVGLRLRKDLHMF